MRRKVDDIGRKLDHMYDLLRQSRLSPDILQGLHAIAQGGWSLHTFLFSLFIRYSSY